MKPIVRLLLVCYLLLALPFQAFAAASMRLPIAGVSSVAVAKADLPPCHQQMAKAAAAHGGHAEAHADNHTKSDCGSCGACYVGAAMAPSLPATPAPAPPSTASIPFRAGYLPSVDPVLPERPPSILAA